MKKPLKPTILPPVSSKLKKHIAYYYCLTEKDEKSHFNFSHYPHYQTSLVFFKNAEFVEDKNVRHITCINEDNLKCIFNNNLIGARKEVVSGRFNIIGIVFHPLGAKHFLKINSTDAEDFYKDDLNEVFTLRDMSNRVSKLDEMFEKSYQDFDQPILKHVVDIILDRKGNIYLDELTEILNISRRTIHRKFKSHLNCSFQDFKSIVKFRKTLEHGVQKTQPGKLSDLAYDFDYYDQSDLVKVFKSKTEETPKKMLADITLMSDKLIWKLKLD